MGRARTDGFPGGPSRIMALPNDRVKVEGLQLKEGYIRAISANRT